MSLCFFSVILIPNLTIHSLFIIAFLSLLFPQLHNLSLFYGLHHPVEVSKTTPYFFISGPALCLICSCPPPIVSSLGVALLIGISVCGICSFSHSSSSSSLCSLAPLSCSACAAPDAAWQVLRPTSIFHKKTQHTYVKKKSAYTHSRLPKCVWGT